MRSLALITMAVTALASPSLRAQTPAEGGLQARVWLDRGDEPVLRRGETVRIYYRTSQDAYAAIFRIDTDGRISMIFPQDPVEHFVRGGRDYRLVFPRSPIWRVDEDPGAGYFFMVASPEPLDFSAFPFDPAFGWDLAAVGDVVYEDPYIAIDDYVARLIPNWEVVPYALDFVTYNVGDTYTYPRFLCYDCHEARPYASWNPYAIPCTSYRVVIWDDPYFYPRYRYSGTSVLVVRPAVTQPRYAVAARAPGDSYRPLIRTRPAPPRVTAEFKEAPSGAAPAPAARRISPEPATPTPRPTLQRRETTPSSRLPVRTPSTASDGGATQGRATPDARIVRPPTRSATPTPAPGRPSQGVTPSPSSRGGATGSARPAAPSRPSTRPSSGSRPTARPSAPSRPSAQPRPRTQPSAPSRPSTQPRPRTQPSAPSRPATPSRPSPRPSTGNRPSAQPSAPSRPSTRPAAPARPTAPSRPNTSGSRPGE